MPRNKAIEREYKARRSIENQLWARANTERKPGSKKGGIHISALLKLNRMVAEDIREIRSHGLDWFSSVTGRPSTNADREHNLAELEAVYNRTEEGIARAEADMTERGIPIPRQMLDRYLAPKAVASDAPAPMSLGEKNRLMARSSSVSAQPAVEKPHEADAPSP